MVSIHLMGGLGNQMFQMATTYAVAQKMDTECAFNFNECWTPNQGNSSVKYKDTFFKNFNELNEQVIYTAHWSEPSFGYTEIDINTSVKALCLHGYFQSEKYFKDYKKDIVFLFTRGTFGPSVTDDVIDYATKIFDKNNKPIVTLHIRRGDYLNNEDYHTNLTKTGYYEKAMKEFNKVNFIVISDDIDWCKNNFKGDDIYYSPFTNELQDLYLMTISSGLIIANSSFSWWGAYLNSKTEYNNYKVIAPKNWFGPKGPKDTQDLIPENWIKI